MALREHGISIGLFRHEGDLFVRLKVRGKLNHADYQMMVPMLEQAMAGIDQPKVRMLVICDQFQGWEARAAWDDFKFGLKHGREFSKIAIVGDKPWEKAAARVGSWFMEGDMQFFEDRGQAVRWLEQ